MNFANNLSSQISAAMSAESEAISVNSAFASAVQSAGLPIQLTLSQPPGTTESSWEIVTVTAVVGSSLSVLRAQDDTQSLIWPVGSSISCRITAGQLSRMSPRTKTVGHGYQITPDDDGATLLAAGTMLMQPGDWQDGARVSVIQHSPAYTRVDGVSVARNKDAAPESWRSSISLHMTSHGEWIASGNLSRMTRERLLVGSGGVVYAVTGGAAEEVATLTGTATALYSPDGTLAVICDDAGGVGIMDTATGTITDVGMPADTYYAQQWRSDSEYALIYRASGYAVISREGVVQPLSVDPDYWPVWQGEYIVASSPTEAFRYSVDGAQHPCAIPPFTFCFSGLRGNEILVRRIAQADWAVYSESDAVVSEFDAPETSSASISHDGSMIAMQAESPSRILVYSLATGQSIQSIPAGAMSYGFGAPSWSADSKELWFTQESNPRLVSLDTSTWTVSQQINMPAPIDSISTARH